MVMRPISLPISQSRKRGREEEGVGGGLSEAPLASSLHHTPSSLSRRGPPRPPLEKERDRVHADCYICVTHMRPPSPSSREGDAPWRVCDGEKRCSEERRGVL